MTTIFSSGPALYGGLLASPDIQIPPGHRLFYLTRIEALLVTDEDLSSIRFNQLIDMAEKDKQLAIALIGLQKALTLNLEHLNRFVNA